jgi:hypothetical protein
MTTRILEAAQAVLPARGGDGADKIAMLLRAVQRSDDAMRCQHDLYATLQQFDAADFRNASMDLGGLIALVRRFEKLPWEIVEGAADGAVERWLEVDPESALAWLKGSASLLKLQDDGAMIVMQAVAKRRPSETLDYALTLKPGELQQSIIGKVFENLSGEELKNAPRLLDRISEPAAHRSAQRGLQIAIARVDPMAALDSAASMKDKAAATELALAAVMEGAMRGPGVLKTMAVNTTNAEALNWIITLLSGSDPEEAARMATDFVAKTESPALAWTQQSAAQSVARSLAAKDVNAAVEWADNLPINVRAAALREVASIWARQDPEAAVAWFDAHPSREAMNTRPPLQTDPRATVFSTWLSTDEAAARAWRQTLPRGELRDLISGSLIVNLARTDRASEAAFLFAESGATAQPLLARQVATALAREDPMRAAAWAAELPAGTAQNLGVAAAVQAWAVTDAHGAAEWVTKFPQGDLRDRAIAAYAQAIARVDLDAAAEWVLQVDDSWQRTRAADALLLQKRERDPVDAERWLRELPGIDETARQHLLSTFQ